MGGPLPGTGRPRSDAPRTRLYAAHQAWDGRSRSGPLHGPTGRIAIAQHVGAGEMGTLEARFGHRGRVGDLFLPDLVDELAEDPVMRGITTDASGGVVEDAPGTLVVAVAIALDRLLSCPSGEQPGDGPVDVRVPRLVVVGPVVSVAPCQPLGFALTGTAGPEHAVAIGQRHDAARLPADVAVREV